MKGWLYIVEELSLPATIATQQPACSSLRAAPVEIDTDRYEGRGAAADLQGTWRQEQQQHIPHSETGSPPFAKWPALVQHLGRPSGP